MGLVFGTGTAYTSPMMVAIGGGMAPAVRTASGHSLEYATLDSSEGLATGEMHSTERALSNMPLAAAVGGVGGAGIAVVGVAEEK